MLKEAIQSVRDGKVDWAAVTSLEGATVRVVRRGTGVRVTIVPNRDKLVLSEGGEGQGSE